ncbi:hypothetical protein MNBD_ALPHA03-414 [hydrothermal vent metagenome]|uniref:Uncharacterized protein n=1 Tax=hydrothermal vent metagenome TaxID=652676 RepID=A0A3B1AP93_9ZZZZ
MYNKLLRMVFFKKIIQPQTVSKRDEFQNNVGKLYNILT